ncbi:hypothetical protein NE237_003907 [Protea cynaroides]|uniref:Uncharacterized protein n=1 Tax=Protea cynaroides TaxID=273540 RepID=A0A9Q0KHP4_9MAGN|nr:hypothetical protein NE237_003907 [Protea cynaroides]
MRGMDSYGNERNPFSKRQTTATILLSIVAEERRSRLELETETAPVAIPDRMEIKVYLEIHRQLKPRSKCHTNQLLCLLCSGRAFDVELLEAFRKDGLSLLAVRANILAKCVAKAVFGTVDVTPLFEVEVSAAPPVVSTSGERRAPANDPLESCMLAKTKRRKSLEEMFNNS